MKEKAVFVVHGRNHAALDATSQFLRALGLHPIAWKDAVKLTGRPAPTTFEVVKAGIDSASCALVILGGDDIAKLRLEYGSEAFSYQPRPNVIFEAGWALGIFGPERTILIKPEQLRELSDINGLTYLVMDNSAEARIALRERLELAGLKSVGSSDAYLRPQTGGNFEAAFEQEDDGPNLLQRGGFTDVIVDASLSYSISSLNLLEELEQAIVDGSYTDLKYNYLGAAGADNWLTLSTNPEYGQGKIRDFIKKNIHHLLTKSGLTSEEYVDVVSLGTGDGRLDASLLWCILEHSKIRTFYPLDISFELLQKSISNVISNYELCGNFRMKAVHGDFNNLWRYKPVYGFDSHPNIIMMLGLTFGNHQESNLLYQIGKGMNAGDILIFDARTHQEGNMSRLSKEQSASFTRSYHHALNNRFAFGPIALATNADFKAAKFEYVVNQRMTSVPNAWNVVTSAVNLRGRTLRRKRAFNHKRIDLASTTLYDADSLLKWVASERGFDVVESDRGDGLILIALKRTDDPS